MDLNSFLNVKGFKGTDLVRVAVSDIKRLLLINKQLNEDLIASYDREEKLMNNLMEKSDEISLLKRRLKEVNDIAVTIRKLTDKNNKLQDALNVSTALSNHRREMEKINSLREPIIVEIFA